MKITNEMREQLRKPLPKEAVTKHPTKTYLSSIKAIYVTERLNDVFGVGAWNTKTEIVNTLDNGMVVVKVIFTIPEYGVYHECFGGNDNGGEKSKNFDLGDAYKGAMTDAITKICSWLEIGIDVFKGLHDSKSQLSKPTYGYLSALKSADDFNQLINKTPLDKMSREELSAIWDRCKEVAVSYDKEKKSFFNYSVNQ